MKREWNVTAEETITLVEGQPRRFILVTSLVERWGGTAYDIFEDVGDAYVRRADVDEREDFYAFLLTLVLERFLHECEWWQLESAPCGICGRRVPKDELGKTTCNACLGTLVCDACSIPE